MEGGLVDLTQKDFEIELGGSEEKVVEQCGVFYKTG